MIFHMYNKHFHFCVVIKLRKLIEMEFDLNNDAPCMGENPVAGKKIKMESDETHQSCMHNESVLQLLVKEEIKQEDSIKTEGIIDDECVSFNTDMSLCIEERIPVNIMYCEQCNYGTNDKSHLIDHIFTHRFKCNECDYTTPEKSMLITHTHDVCNVRNCLGIDVLNEHMSLDYLSTKQEKYREPTQINECHDCLYSTNSKSTPKKCLNGQLAKATLRTQLRKCEKCEYSTSETKYLSMHACYDKCDYETHHKHKLIEDKKPFECSLCDYSAKRQSQLKVHLTMHSGERNFSCDKCDYTTFSKNHLTKHKVVHSERKPFQCSLCDFSTRHRSSLKVHLRIHSGQRNFSCDKCDYTAYKKTQLTDHKVVHSEQKPFECSLCDFRAKRRSHLKLHLKIHSGERNFSCDKCDYTTFSKNQLTNHKVVHSEQKPFECSLCDFSTRHRSSLKVHLRIHSGQRNFSCDKCDYTTFNKHQLTNHKVVHSEQKPFECSSFG